MNKQTDCNKVWTEIYLLLGTNIGERVKNLEKCRELLSSSGIQITSESSLYETEAWGKKDQEPFLNQVIKIESSLNPMQLLNKIQDIEKEAGRVRYEKWGPRILDIDILYFGKEIVVEENLKIPHPAIQDRLFTLIPLVEIASDFKHPVLNLTNSQLLSNCKDQLEVKKL